MLKGKRVSKHGTVQSNTVDQRAPKGSKTPLKHSISHPLIKEQDLAANQHIVSNAAMRKRQNKPDLQRKVQGQVSATYFKVEQTKQDKPPLKRPEGKQPFEYYSLKTLHVEPHQISADQTQTATSAGNTNKNSLKATQIQISPVKGVVDPSGFKTAKHPFRRKPEYFKGQSRESSASSQNRNSTGGSLKRQNRSQDKLAENALLQLLATVSAKQDVQQPCAKQRKGFPAPLPPSQGQKHGKAPLQKHKPPSLTKHPLQAKTCTDAEIEELRAKAGSPSLHQLAEFIIGSKASAILKPKHFDMFNKEHPSQGPQSRPKSSSQNSRFKNKQKKSTDRTQQPKASTNRKQSQDSAPKATPGEATKSKDHSQKRIDDKSAQRQAANQPVKPLCSVENQPFKESTLRKFAAYRARLINKQIAASNSQKLLYRTMNKPMPQLYTPSQTLRRTQQMTSRHSNATHPDPRQVDTSPNETKRTNKPTQYDIYKRSTKFIAQAQMLDVDESNNKQQTSTLTPTDNARRSTSYRSQHRQRFVRRKKSAKSQKRKSNIVNDDQEEFNLVNVQIQPKSNSKNARQSGKKPRSESKRRAQAYKTETPTMINAKETLDSQSKQSKQSKTKASVKSKPEGDWAKPIVYADPFVSIEPSNSKFFDQTPNKSSKNSPAEAPPVQPTVQQRQQKKLQNCLMQLMSLIETQKMRAKGKHIIAQKEEAEFLRIQENNKRKAVIRIQRWFRAWRARKALKQLKQLSAKSKEERPLQVVTQEVEAEKNDPSMSSTLRVQNLIKQKIEKRQREAMLDSFNMHHSLTERAKQQEDVVSYNRKTSEVAEASRKDGLILVGLNDEKTSRRSKHVQRSQKQDHEVSVTLSRIMLEESMQFMQESKGVPTEPDEVGRLSQRVKSVNYEPQKKPLFDQFDPKQLKELDVATNQLSPILHKQSSSPLLAERQVSEREEERSQHTQQLSSDAKMRRFDEKFPTPQQLYRINSQNSFVGSMRTNDYNCLPQQQAVNMPSKLIYTGQNSSQVLATSQRSIAHSNTESLDRHKLKIEAPLKAIVNEITQHSAHVDVHVEDQQNDSQRSFINEDSKSDPYSEAPFEKSSHEIQKCQATSTEDVNQNSVHEPDSVMSPSSPQSSMTSEKSIDVEHEYNLLSAPREQTSHASASANAQRGTSATNMAELSQNSNSFTDSAAPCSGVARPSNIEPKPFPAVETKPETTSPTPVVEAPENSLAQTPTPDSVTERTLSQLKSVDSSLVSRESSKKVEELNRDLDMVTMKQLAEIKQANDLASFKIELCNQIFEMLVNEVKTELFPKRAEIQDIDVGVKSEPIQLKIENRVMESVGDGIKKKWVDEKAPSIRRPKQERDKPEKLNRSFDNLDKFTPKQRANKKDLREKTVPAVKRTERGKAKPVDFDRFKFGHAFFKRQKQEGRNLNYTQFLANYINGWSSEKTADSQQQPSLPPNTDIRQAVTSFHFHHLEGTKQTMQDHFNAKLAQNEKEQKSKLARKKLGVASLKPEAEKEPELVLNLRGIKTSTDVAEQYVENSICDRCDQSITFEL